MDTRGAFLSMQLPVRAAVSATLALVIAELLRLPHPIYAFIAAVIVIDLQPAVSRQLGLRRVWATVIGAVCGAIASLLLPPAPLNVGLGVLAAMLVAQLLQAKEGVRVAGYISGIVLLEHADEPVAYAVLRFVETIVGVLAAWGISYVPKLIKVEGSGEADR